MATGQQTNLKEIYEEPMEHRQGKLGTDDGPSERLLLKIANHVKYSEFNLLRLATDLGMAEGRFTQKTVPHSESLMKIVEVLRYWHQATAGLTVKSVIDRVKKWLKEDMIDREVWTEIQPLVDFELPSLPSLPPLQPSETVTYSIEISEERWQEIKQYTKQSLREKPFSTAKGKIWTETPSSIPLKSIFTKLCWVKKRRTIQGVESEELSDITELLTKHTLEENGPIRILVKGPGGIGKSTAMKHLALIWADGAVAELNMIDIIFHISLKDVQTNQSLENIIVEQHKGLKRRKVQLGEIKSILEGHKKRKALIILDGHEEYRKGTNKYIDEAITKDNLPDCCIILTSRETKDLPEIRDYMDAEAEITGFDEERVKEYITKYLGSSERCKELLKIALKSKIINEEDSNNTEPADSGSFNDSGVEDMGFGSLSFTSLEAINEDDGEEVEKVEEEQNESLGSYMWRMLSRLWLCSKKRGGEEIINEEEKGLVQNLKLLVEEHQEDDCREEKKKRKKNKDYGILCIPILLHMICILFLREVSLPRTVTGIMTAIVERCSDWDGIRTTGHKKVKDMKDTLIRLGEFVLKKLQQDDPQQIFDKEDILQAVGEKAFKLGLLMGAECDMSEEVSTQVYCFHHLLLLEYTAGTFVSTLHTKQLQRLFPTWEVILKYREVIRFACGLTGDTQTVLGFVYETWVQHIVQQKGTHDFDDSFLKLFCEEVSEFATVDPLRNKYFNYMDSASCNLDRFVPSKFYIFSLDDTVAIDWAVVTSNIRSTTKVNSRSSSAECIVHVKGDRQLCDTFRLIQEIGQYQTISTVGLDIQGANFSGEFFNSDESFASDSDSHDDFCDVTPLFIETIKISRDVRSVALCLCNISDDAYGHISEQLHDRNKIEKLHLDNTKGVPSELGVSVATMTSLKELQMQRCNMTSRVSGLVLKGLSQCTHLVVIKLSFNTLTDRLEALFGGDSPHWFPSLRTLEVEKTNLSINDVSCLTQALHSKMLPKLENLDLSNNTLTDCIGQLLGLEGPLGLSSLVWFWLWNTKLSKADVNSITQAVTSCKVPRLRYLHLEHNNLYFMQEEVEDLVEACIAHYVHKDLIIDVYYNELPDSFKRRMRSICQGTNVDLPLWVD